MKMSPERRTETLCRALGWQGGTVHQACKEIGVPVHDFLYADVELENGLASNFILGQSAIRTCSKEFFLNTLKPKNIGNLQYWFGVCAGQNLIELENS